MSNAIYPQAVRGLTFTVTVEDEFSTIIQSSPSKYEARLPQTQNPIHHWTLVYEYLKDFTYDLPPSGTNGYTDLAFLRGFWNARQGQFDSFLFVDWTDPHDGVVGPALISGSPNLAAQLQLLNDGAGTYYSPVQIYRGGQFYEDITDLNGSIAVYANGSLTTNYTILGPGVAFPGFSFMGLVLKWNTAPVGPITAQFNFWYRARFESDAIDFERFSNELWTIGGSQNKNGAGSLKIISARPPLA